MSRGPRVPSELEATPRGEKKERAVPAALSRFDAELSGCWTQTWVGRKQICCLLACSLHADQTDGRTDGQNETGTARDDELQTYPGDSGRHRQPNSLQGAASALLSARISSLPPVSSPPCDRHSLFSSPYICTYK